MSSYDNRQVVLSAEARRRIALAESRSRLDAAMSHLVALHREVAAACGTYPGEVTAFDLPRVPTGSEDLAEMDRATKNMTDQWVEHRRRFHGEEQQIHRRMMLESLENVGDGEATTVGEVLDDSPTGAGESIESRAMALVETVDAGCTDDDRTAVRTIVEKIRTAHTAQRQGTLFESLLDTVSRANHSAAEQRLRAGRADRLRADLVGVDGLPDAALMRRIDLAEAGLVPFDGVLASAVSDAADASVRRAEETYVSEAAERALQSLGYRVQTGFADELAGGTAYARLDDWPDHAVRFSLNGEVLASEQVRVTGPAGDPTLDGTAQVALCEHHTRFLAELKAGGIDTDDAELVPAGVFASTPVDISGVEFEPGTQDQQIERFLGGS